MVTDTGSVIYKTQAENIYKELFDFSSYLKYSKYYNNVNKSVADKMKDETCGLSVKGHVGLVPKMYTFITRQKALIKMNVDDDKLNYEYYKNVLCNRLFMRHAMNRIQSKDLNIGWKIINNLFSSCHQSNIYVQIWL